MQRPMAPEKLEHSELFVVAEGWGVRGCDYVAKAKSQGDRVLKVWTFIEGRLMRGHEGFFPLPMKNLRLR